MEFAKRSEPRIDPNPEDFGADVETETVDQIAQVLRLNLIDSGFILRDYSGVGAVLGTGAEDAAASSSPVAPVIMGLGGEATLEALEGDVDATAFFKGASLPRQEPIMLDDGGTLVSGESQGDTDKVLKILIRDHQGANAHLALMVEECLKTYHVDVEEAKRGSRAEAGGIVYALKRY